jgi:biofilm protein TabA
MIIDQMSNSHLYHSLHPRIKPAFDYLLHTDLATLSIGRHEINGEILYAMLQQYTSKPREQAAWEAHRRYIDLQVVLQGVELIGYANIDHLTQGEYNAEKDFLPLFGEGDFLTLQNGNFSLLFPQDAHLPGIAIAAPGPVRKIVIKIRIDQSI